MFVMEWILLFFSHLYRALLLFVTILPPSIFHNHRPKKSRTFSHPLNREEQWWWSWKIVIPEVLSKNNAFIAFNFQFAVHHWLPPAPASSLAFSWLLLGGRRSPSGSAPYIYFPGDTGRSHRGRDSNASLRSGADCLTSRDGKWFAAFYSVF